MTSRNGDPILLVGALRQHGLAKQAIVVQFEQRGLGELTTIVGPVRSVNRRETGLQRRSASRGIVGA